jgi:hypothetical protein
VPKVPVIKDLSCSEKQKNLQRIKTERKEIIRFKTAEYTILSDSLTLCLITETIPQASHIIQTFPKRLTVTDRDYFI